MKMFLALAVMVAAISGAQVVKPQGDNAGVIVRETTVNVPAEVQREFLINRILFGKSGRLTENASEGLYYQTLREWRDDLQFVDHTLDGVEIQAILLQYQTYEGPVLGEFKDTFTEKEFSLQDLALIAASICKSDPIRREKYPQASVNVTVASHRLIAIQRRYLKKASEELAIKADIEGAAQMLRHDN